MASQEKMPFGLLKFPSQKMIAGRRYCMLYSHYFPFVPSNPSSHESLSSMISRNTRPEAIKRLELASHIWIKEEVKSLCSRETLGFSVTADFSFYIRCLEVLSSSKSNDGERVEQLLDSIQIRCSSEAEIAITK